MARRKRADPDHGPAQAQGPAACAATAHGPRPQGQPCTASRPLTMDVAGETIVITRDDLTAETRARGECCCPGEVWQPGVVDPKCPQHGGRILGYRIGDRIYAPEDVTILRAEPHP